MWTHLPTGPKRLESRAEFVYRAVREMILRGELLPGKPLSRRVLAKELGVSILPVSEALQRLEYDGLLESKPRAGTRVKVPTWEEVRDSFVIREALDAMCARLFTQAATPAEKSELLEMGEELDRGIRNKEVFLFDYNGLHERFHRRIAGCARCSTLAVGIEQTHAVQQTWIAVTVPGAQLLPDPNHAELVRMLVQGPPERADAAMRGHVDTQKRHLMSLLESRFSAVANREFVRRAKRKQPPWKQGKSGPAGG